MIKGSGNDEFGMNCYADGRDGAPLVEGFVAALVAAGYRELQDVAGAKKGLACGMPAPLHVSGGCLLDLSAWCPLP